MSNAIVPFNLSDVGFDTPVVIQTSDKSSAISLTALDVVRVLVPQAPQNEALKFLMVCKSVGANPLAGDIELISMGGKWTPIFKKPLYAKRARINPLFDGMESGIVIQKIEYAGKEVKYCGELMDIPGGVLPFGYVVRGGWAKVYRKGVQRPTYTRIDVDEYSKNSPTWKSMTCTMCIKVAEVHAYRDEFGFSEGYDECEIDPDLMPNRIAVPQSSPAVVMSVSAPTLNPMEGSLDEQYAAAGDTCLNPQICLLINETCNSLGVTDEQFRGILERRNVSHLGQLSDQQGMELYNALKAKLDALQPAPQLATA